MHAALQTSRLGKSTAADHQTEARRTELAAKHGSGRNSYENRNG